MFSWSSSAISKIQKWLVYWVEKLCLSALCTCLALTHTIPADIRQNCNRAKIPQVSGEFQHFFSEADDWQMIFGPCSVYAKKRSIGTSGAPQIRALQTSHNPWIYYLLLSVEEFPLNSHWVESQWPITLGEIFLGWLFSSLSLTLYLGLVSEGVQGIATCQDLWGTFAAALQGPGGVEDSCCVWAESTTETWLICVLLELEELLGRRILLQHFPNTVLGKGNGITTRKKNGEQICCDAMGSLTKRAISDWRWYSVKRLIFSSVAPRKRHWNWLRRITTSCGTLRGHRSA